MWAVNDYFPDESQPTPRCDTASWWAVGGYLLRAGNGVQDPIHTQVYKAHVT